MVTRIKNGNLLLPDGITAGDLYIRDGLIIAPLGTFDREIDAKGCYVGPGFIDLHVHGGGGYDFIDGTTEAYLKIAEFHLRHGTVSLLPTLVTASDAEIIKSLKAYNAAKRQKCSAGFLGVHMEGPYFGVSQKGAQDTAYFQDVSQKRYLKYYEVCPDIIRWSAAPETDAAGEFAAFCRGKNILLSVAHSGADYPEIVKAREQGYRMFTHLYSGMTGVSRKNCYRAAGAVEAAFLFDDMYAEIIADLKHLPEELIRLVYKIKGSGRNILVTDAMRAAGQNAGVSTLGSLKNGQKVIIEDGVAKLPDRSSFAGSIATADMLVRNVVSCGISLRDAVKMMTETPADIIGRKDIGRIAPGARADLVIFDKDVNIKTVIKNGKPIDE